MELLKYSNIALDLLVVNNAALEEFPSNSLSISFKQSDTFSKVFFLPCLHGLVFFRYSDCKNSLLIVPSIPSLQKILPPDNGRLLEWQLYGLK